MVEYVSVIEYLADMAMALGSVPSAERKNCILLTGHDTVTVLGIRNSKSVSTT